MLKKTETEISGTLLGIENVRENVKIGNLERGRNAMNLQDQPLRTLKGIGEKTELLFAKAGIRSLEDLLHYYPREYDCYEEPVSAGEAVPGEKNAVRAVLTARPSVRTFGKQSITMVTLRDGGKTLQVNWFHMPFLRSTLQVGKTYIFRGSVTEKGGRRIMEHPELFRPEEYDKICGQLLPVYSLTAGLSNRTVRKAVQQLLEMKPAERDYIPEEIRASYGLCGINDALRQIHFPENRAVLQKARSRLAFGEFFLFLLGVERMKAGKNAAPNHFPMKKTWVTEQAAESLPYPLTGAQQRVWRELEKDLSGQHLMNRLIQGDVGSGKTILAFLAMIMAAQNGFQSALMAPTEVLAMQHYKALTELLEKNSLSDFHPVLLRGSCTAKEKKEIKEEIRSGRTRMIIGTHALIQESVDFERLGLVITDEQHRFGVRQRETLAEKGTQGTGGGGAEPHVLVMSATPIPRTLAMILYGDLDISILDEMPARRLPVKNAVVDTSWRENAYRFIRRETEAGHQAYVICPMVEPNEEISCENVTDYTEKLKKVFGGAVRVEMLHGQMKAQKKQEIMEAFADGSIQVLVSTTVVEVGVNVPNATVMLIENAERFGLAQLHQLRGRVGRGSAQSYCIFMQGDGKKETAERLKVLQKSNDGFYIAEQDLKLRGPGDLLGVRQSGIALFEVADIYRDAELLKEAGKAVRRTLEKDPGLELPENRALCERVEELLKKQKTEN